MAVTGQPAVPRCVGHELQPKRAVREERAHLAAMSLLDAAHHAVDAVQGEAGAHRAEGQGDHLGGDRVAHCSRRHRHAATGSRRAVGAGGARCGGQQQQAQPSPTAASREMRSFAANSRFR